MRPKDWGFRFAAFDLRMPNGQLVEYYMPVKEVELAKKNGNHQIFEKWRNKTSEEIAAQYKEYVKDVYKSRQQYNQAWENYLMRAGLTPSEAAASWSKISESLPSMVPL